jgi:hypothetical protein
MNGKNDAGETHRLTGHARQPEELLEENTDAS